MTEPVEKPKRKKRIQLNILLRMILSLVISISISDVYIFFSVRIGNALGSDWYLQYFPYLNLPLFIVAFIVIFLLLTRGIVKDLIQLEQGLEILSLKEI